MPEFRVIFVREVLIFKYARYERQDLLISKEFGIQVKVVGWWVNNKLTSGQVNKLHVIRYNSVFSTNSSTMLFNIIQFFQPTRLLVSRPLVNFRGWILAGVGLPTLPCMQPIALQEVRLMYVIWTSLVST
jgi:hypothetical protein